MNIFTTDAFLETAGALFFPKRSRRVELCHLEGLRLRLLVLDDTEIAEQLPCYDFAQPLDGEGPVDREISYFPRTVLHTTTVEERTPEAEGQRPSPYVDWKKHATLAAFEAEWKVRGGTKSNDSARQRRRLEKDLGPLVFQLDDPSPEVFETCVRWKSGQYLATGLDDLFADPRNVALFRGLRERGVLLVSSLRAGNTLLAAHLGSSHAGRFGWWIPSYDPELGKFSPGRLLLEDALAASHARGDLEFDFLVGDEAYKFQYATHNRVIGAVGVPPLSTQLLKSARTRVKSLLEKSPKALELARSWHKRLSALTS